QPGDVGDSGDARGSQLLLEVDQLVRGGWDRPAGAAESELSPPIPTDREPGHAGQQRAAAAEEGDLLSDGAARMVRPGAVATAVDADRAARRRGRGGRRDG